jgi:predicted dehydrogenase
MLFYLISKETIMFKALVIGCGNIGAGYDFANDEISTHAKAYFKNKNFALSIFDTDKNTVKKVKEKYDCAVVPEINAMTIAPFDCVSICTPTATHFKYLKAALEIKNKVIICEKPISYSYDELSGAESLYRSKQSKVLVNYVRRFQPDYINLKHTVRKLMMKERFTNISIRYQRGFINNCSHALDLLQFLTETELNLKNIIISNRVKDHFENDPTLSMTCAWGDTNVSILGLSNVRFSLFEIELYFEHTRISILNSGKSINICSAQPNKKFLQPLQVNAMGSKEDCLKNSMANVVAQAYQLLVSREAQDNFISALKLNQLILKAIEN